MTTEQLDFRPEELLADPAYAEPLVIGGVRCHGGFDDDGIYRSPRTRHRMAAVTVWQANHEATFGTSLLHAPVETWPGMYPNLDQARFLLRNGVREPIVAALTRIGTVEGFGAMIRFLAPADLQPFFADDISGTATAHLGRGLVEAHARDEAGWEQQAGHDRMWYAVRDIAFENPVTEDETALMLERLGVPVGAGGDPGAAAERFAGRRQFDDLDFGLEMLLSVMLRVLFVEIKAFHVFAWAEELLSDGELVAGDGEAARLVSYIRQDETPHVEYLRTALSEMRERTFVGESGRRIPGSRVIDTLWDASLSESLGVMEEQNRAATLREIERAIGPRRGAADLLAEFHTLGDPVEPAAV